MAVSGVFGTGDTPLLPVAPAAATAPVAPVAPIDTSSKSPATGGAPFFDRRPTTGPGSAGGATGGTAASTTVSSDALLATNVQSILGFQTGSAAADASAEGYRAESDAYGRVSSIADQNALIAGVSGDIQSLQEARKVSGTIGAARATTASAGFSDAGSSMDILKSSLQQGYLGQQLIQTQTALTQGGYLEESAAAMGTKTAADAAAAGAANLSATDKAAADNQTAALNSYLSGKTLTAAEKLILAPITGDTNIAGDLTDAASATTATDTSAATGGNSTAAKDIARGFTIINGQMFKVGKDGQVMPNQHIIAGVPL